MSNAIFPLDQLNRADLTTILKDLRSIFGLEVKLNAKTEDLKAALIDSFKDLKILDYVIANYSPVDRFNSELALIAKQLGLKLTLKKCLSVLMPKIDPAPNPVSTQDRIKAVKPGSKVNTLPKKIGKVKDLSAVSLQDQFASVGFKDQNDELILTDVAQIVLTTLWELDPVEYPDIAPNGHVRQNGYYSPAIITVKPVTQQIETGKVDQDGNKVYRDMPVYRVNHRTVIEANKVLRNSSRNGVSDRKLDLLPFIAGNEVLIENIVSVQWFVTSPIEARPDQRKKASTLRKNSIKSKRSWSTRYVRTVLDPQVSYGCEVNLPLKTKTVKYRLVLEAHGKVSLYQNGSLYRVLGRWNSHFDHATGQLSVDYFTGEDYPVEWIEPVALALDRLVKSQGKAARSNLSLTMLNNLCQDHRKQYGSRWSLAKYRDFKSKARKAVYGLYYHNPDPKNPNYREPNPKSPLPFDVQRLCYALDNRQDLTEGERAEFNKALIGYALYAGLVGGTKRRNDTFRDRHY